MYKTSAAYNAFVCHKRTLGTTLEVCLGESGGDCSTASLGREVGFSARRNIWILPGSPVIGIRDTTASGTTGNTVSHSAWRDTYVMMSHHQRWPMGFEGSVRLG